MPDNNSTRPFLYMEQKEDSAEKLAYAAGKPTKHFFFAPELMRTVGAVNELWRLIQALQLPTSTILELIGDKVVDFDEIGDLDILDVINSAEGDGVYLGVPNATYISFKQNGLMRVYAFVGVSGDYGSGEGLHTLMDSDLLQLVYEVEGQSSPASNPDVFEAVFYLVEGGNPVIADSPHIADFTPTFVRNGPGSFTLASVGLNPLPKFATVFMSMTTHLHTVSYAYSTQNEIKIYINDNATGALADPPGNLTRLSMRIAKPTS